MNKKMRRIVIQLPHDLKRRLDALRSKGYSASGFIRHLLERSLSSDGSSDGERRT
jgi:metal-responsive CopG/Arc/MetJ family transcriptional regulator